MALTEGTDFVYVPVADRITEKVCLTGTKQRLYVVPDRKAVQQGFLADALSSTRTYESLKVGDKALREVIAEVLAHPATTLDGLHELFTELKAKWEPLQIIELGDLKRLKVSPGWWIFPGSILAKFEGDLGYTSVVTAIRRPHKVAVAEFYAEVVEQVNGSQ